MRPAVHSSASHSHSARPALWDGLRSMSCCPLRSLNERSPQSVSVTRLPPRRSGACGWEAQFRSAMRCKIESWLLFPRRRRPFGTLCGDILLAMVCHPLPRNLNALAWSASAAGCAMVHSRAARQSGAARWLISYPTGSIWDSLHIRAKPMKASTMRSSTRACSTRCRRSCLAGEGWVVCQPGQPT